MNQILEPQQISYDSTPIYENDWNGINGGNKDKDKHSGHPINNHNPFLGGEAIASGGYGCVFKPALRCKNSNHRPSGKISKLMLKKYAEREYQEIQRFQKVLSTLPNYTDYFILNDFTLCEPAPLTEEDITNFKKCRALPKDGINEKNINQSLPKILALTMPDGGIPVDDYIRKTTNYHYFVNLNNTLIQLLNKGIVPMNKRHIYHSDIKDSNVLVEEKDVNHLYTRLIDWGISVQYVPKSKFPDLWKNRPFQFNTPFSVILFTDLFIEKYTKFINEKKETIQSTNYKEVIGAFVIDYVYLWMKERGPGHYKAINNMFYILFSEELENIEEKERERIIEMNYTMVYIKNYLTEIIYHFSTGKNNYFDVESYLNKVFVKLIDVWGFVSIYFCILEELFEYKASLTFQEKELFNSLKHIILTYLYNPRITPISITKLSKDLKNLDQYFEQKNKLHNTSHFLLLKSQTTKKSSISKKKRFQTLIMATTTNSKKEGSIRKKTSINKKNVKTRKNSRIQ